MPRLDRYLVREILPPFAVAVLLVVLGVFLSQARRLAGAALGLGVTLEDGLVIFVSALPPFLMLALPIAYLLGVLVGLGRLGHDLELVALQASGASPWRIARAPALLGLAVSLATVPVAVYGEPLGLRALHARLVSVGLENLSRALEPGVFNESFRGTAVYAAASDGAGRLEDILVYDARDPARPALLLARAGQLAPEPERGVAFDLEGGELHLGLPTRPEAYERARFEGARLGLDADQEVSRRVQFVSVLGRLTTEELRAEIERLGPSDPLALRMAKTRWRRLAFPSMAFVFAVVGAAIALGGAARTRTRSAVLGMAAVVGYYLLTRLADLGVAEAKLSPFWMTWAPNLVLLAAGASALARAGRPR